MFALKCLNTLICLGCRAGKSRFSSAQKGDQDPAQTCYCQTGGSSKSCGKTVFEIYSGAEFRTFLSQTLNVLCTDIKQVMVLCNCQILMLNRVCLFGWFGYCFQIPQRYCCCNHIIVSSIILASSTLWSVQTVLKTKPPLPYLLYCRSR